MGMVLTLYLISANVYNSVDAPNSRVFSYIELWMLGTQFPILIALLEYGYILYLYKFPNTSDNKITPMDLKRSNPEFDKRIKRLDCVTMTISFFSFITFATIYWIIALSKQLAPL
jgi:hypothetical protein